MFGLSSLFGLNRMAVPPALESIVPRPTRRGTPLDYRVKPNRWPNGHTQARQAGRLLTTPGTMQRRWNMLDYYTQAKYGYSAGNTEPYRNR